MPIVDQGDEVLVVPPYMSNDEVRRALVTLSQAMKAQEKREIRPTMNAL